MDQVKSVSVALNPCLPPLLFHVLHFKLGLIVRSLRSSHAEIDTH